MLFNYVTASEILCTRKKLNTFKMVADIAQHNNMWGYQGPTHSPPSTNKVNTRSKQVTYLEIVTGCRMLPFTD